jgi:hypothetical protein
MLRAIGFFLLSGSVFADTLVSGSVYFDSQETLKEVVKLSAAKDNESILKLINDGHVSPQTDTDKNIVVLTSGLASDSPAEFRFVNEPATHWTLTKFVSKEVAAEPTPAATPEQTAAPAATPEQVATPSEKRGGREPENNNPLDDDHGRRVWHKVDGRWKWYPVNRKPVKKALPPDQPLPAEPAKP